MAKSPLARKYPRVAIIKSGWSDDYDGGPVEGDHAWMADGEPPHERYNFRPAPDGKYYVYAHPIGPRKAAPNPRDKDDWLLVYVAKRKGIPGLVVVGWYEQANFIPNSDYPSRPDYQTDALPLDEKGQEYIYTIVADRGYLIPASQRGKVLSGQHLKRSSLIYLRGNRHPKPWHEPLARDLIKYLEEIKKIAQSADDIPPPPRGWISADPERRKEVETKAVEAVVKSLKAMGYGEPDDRQKDNCGWDLEVTDVARKRLPKLEIEVKGTQYPRPHFFISPREFDAMNRPSWRLAMVTNALEQPIVKLLTRTEVVAQFRFKETGWHAEEKI